MKISYEPAGDTTEFTDRELAEVLAGALSRVGVQKLTVVLDY